MSESESLSAYIQTPSDGREPIGYRIAWERVRWPTDENGDPEPELEVEWGWYGAGGWYFDDSPENGTPTLFDADDLDGVPPWEAFDAVCAEYFAHHDPTWAEWAEWATSSVAWEECPRTGAETSLSILPVYTLDGAK